jgi:outer membrane receptor for ferrienterochelin and colicin
VVRPALVLEVGYFTLSGYNFRFDIGADEAVGPSHHNPSSCTPSTGVCMADAVRVLAFGKSRRDRRGARSLCISSALFFVVAMPQTAQASAPANFADLSLEELANIQIVSVSKKFEPLADAPASVFVITADDIRRSGATTLPEALRLAPALQVARANARNYAISARGFDNVFSNKLLVTIDGRTIYSPLFSVIALPQMAQASAPANFADLSLEELANIQIVSVSKKFEPLADAPASVFVITADDIRRSGATTLPEALRLAPALQVARANARNYAISARGFDNVFSNKLLVMIDGRTI